MNKSILEYLENSAYNNPGKVACADDKNSLTYSELMNNAKKVGARLAGLTEVREAIPVYMDKSCTALTIFMGAVYAGCFYCMLDPTHPAERIDTVLNTLEAKLMIVDDKSAKRAEKLSFSGKVINVSALMEGIGGQDGGNTGVSLTEEENVLIEKIRHQALDIDPLYAIFTSGSTGVPKGVVVNHRSTIDFIDTFTEELGITGEDVIGNQAPFDFDVSVKDIYSSLKLGATLQIIPKMMFSFPTKLLDFLEERQVTTLIWAVSALCIVTTLKGFEYKVPSKLNKIMFSGEVMPIKHLNAWREQYPDAKFVNLYGPTEITCNCTYYVIDREFGLEDKLPMGEAFSNEKVFLLDEEDKLVDKSRVGELGEICVSGTCVTMGYFNNDERTKQAFVQNPLNKRYMEIIYRTGDLGVYNEAGELYFASRKDFQIKHMGHRIELGEIETAMNAIEGVIRSCCIFDQENNKIVGFFEVEEAATKGTGDASDVSNANGEKNVDEASVIDKKYVAHELKAKLPQWMVPTDLIRVDAMPLTKNGKIDRKALMEGRE